MIGMVSVFLLGGLSGCDRNADALIPNVSSDYPAVIEIGHMEVVSESVLNFIIDKEKSKSAHIRGDLDNSTPLLLGDFEREAGVDIPTGYEFPGCLALETELNGLTAQQRYQWYLDHGTVDCQTFQNAPDTDHNGDALPYYFGQLGRPPHLTKGGATFTFTGTGDDVCVIVDPETVFWNQSVAPSATDETKLKWGYPDFFDDDGDLDLFGGMSSYYTGSPGVEIGNFQGFYTDSMGEVIEIEYGECNTKGYNGVDYGHAGRGTPEYCTIDTDQQEGVEFTVVMETFSVPLDDGVLSFGVTVVDGRCGDLDTTECFVQNESVDSSGTPRSCSQKLEYAECEGELASFCCANPEMCGDENTLPDRYCQGVYKHPETDETLNRFEWCDMDRDGEKAGDGVMDNPLCCESASEPVWEYAGGGGEGPGGGF